MICNNACCNCCRCPAGASLGVGLFFNESNPNLIQTVAPGNLEVKPDSAGVAVADYKIPLNEFNPLLVMGWDTDDNALVIEQGGLYRISYYAGVQFAPPAAFSLYVALIEGDALVPIAPTFTRVTSGAVLQPRLIQFTGDLCLAQGAKLALAVRVEGAGVLRVIPGAMLSARLIGRKCSPVL